MDVVDKIINNKKIAPWKEIVCLWAVKRLHYNKPLGEKAIHNMIKLTNTDTMKAIAFLSGFLDAKSISKETIRGLISELLETKE